VNHLAIDRSTETSVERLAQYYWSSFPQLSIRRSSQIKSGVVLLLAFPQFGFSEICLLL